MRVSPHIVWCFPLVRMHLSHAERAACLFCLLFFISTTLRGPPPLSPPPSSFQVAWLLNIRGSDVPFNPVVVSYCLVSMSSVALYVDKQKLTPEVRLLASCECKCHSPSSMNAAVPVPSVPLLFLHVFDRFLFCLCKCQSGSDFSAFYE